MSTKRSKWARTYSAVAVLAVLLLIGIVCLAAIGTDTGNPRADFWRLVRGGIEGFTKVSSAGHRILITGGENWRELRNGFVMPFSQWIILLAIAALGLVYKFIGTEKLGQPRSGIMIERFTLNERILHWYTAALFITMAVTGLGLLWGRIALIPILGHPFVSGLLAAAKNLHNICGPFLVIGIAGEVVLWAPNNIPRKYDLLWFKNMGGMLGKGERAHSGKINGGEKAWFLVVAVFGAIVGITGVLLDFPIWGQSRFTMQVSQVVHAVTAVLFVAVSFGHIYMGTLGVEGAFEGMWKGSVDAVWAEEQHDLWYEEMKLKSPEGAAPAGPSPEGAGASD